MNLFCPFMDPSAGTAGKPTTGSQAGTQSHYRRESSCESWSWLPLMPGIQPLAFLSYRSWHTYHRRAAPSSVGQRSDYKTHELRDQMVGKWRRTHAIPISPVCFGQEHRNFLCLQYWGDSFYSLPTSLIYSSSRKKKLLLWLIRLGTESLHTHCPCSCWVSLSEMSIPQAIYFLLCSCSSGKAVSCDLAYV